MNVCTEAVKDVSSDYDVFVFKTLYNANKATRVDDKVEGLTVPVERARNYSIIFCIHDVFMCNFLFIIDLKRKNHKAYSEHEEDF